MLDLPLVDQLLEALQRDQLPVEYDIVDIAADMRISLVQTENGLILGIPAKHVRKIYLHVREKLLDANGLPRTADFDPVFPSLSACLLLIQGDLPIIYQLRREWIRQNQVKLVAEFDLIQLILSKHLKSISCWSHRRWLMRLILENQPDNFKRYRHQELIYTLKLAAKKSRNYFLWNYRFWLLKIIAPADYDELFEDYLLVGQQLSHCITDCSMFSFHFNLLVTITEMVYFHPNNGNDDRKAELAAVWTQKISQTREWIIYYDRGAHETLWYHLRNLFAACHRLLRPSVPLKNLMPLSDEKQWLQSNENSWDANGLCLATNYKRFINYVGA